MASVPEGPGHGGFVDLEAAAALLAGFAARTPAPGGGSAAGVALALGAALCAMAARFSERHLAEAPEMAAAADAWRGRALELAEADAAAYAAVLRARRLPPGEGRDREVAAALEQAVAVPSEIAGLGTEVARLASELAARGNPNLRGDALMAVTLAEAAASGARRLVEINTAPGKPS